MNKDPAFLFYSSDFYIGVAGLNMEERGQYISLLCVEHQQGRLKEKTICSTLGIKSLDEITDVMKKFIKDEDGLYYNQRLEVEAQKRDTYIAMQQRNGLRGGAPRGNQNAKKIETTQKQPKG
ncbi:MAG: DUF1376 domain-containing protein [Spirochaetia bacterium]|nr:DUF1376 domain-containing protein [Spirochaetia bacterium]